MKIILKNFICAVFALLLINTCYAIPREGKFVRAVALTRGGSETAFTWHAPSISTFKVWVQIPKGGSATNALYHIYPNGNSVGNLSCSSTDAIYPCIEIAVNQATHQGKWIQLVLNNNINTAWQFNQNGFVSVNASNISSTEFLSASMLSFEDFSVLSIGQTYQGGIIFYLDDTGKHGLVAAPNDIVDASGNPIYAAWGYIEIVHPTTMQPIYTQTAIGTGQANTTAIVNVLTGGYAANLTNDLVLGGYSDWYLPSNDELNLMYIRIGQGAPAPLTNVGMFASGSYWSSSNTSAYSSWSWTVHFGGGYQLMDLNAYGHLVRAIRSF